VRRTARLKQGQPNEWKALVVVDAASRDAYLRRIQGHVGRWKATWAATVAALGGRVPQWISRHFGDISGHTGLDLSGLSGESKTLSFYSAAPGNNRIEQRVRDAIRSRMRSLSRRIKLVVSGYNKDLAQGMRPRTHAAEHPVDDEQEVQ